MAAHRAAAAAFGGNSFADVFSTSGTSLNEVAYVIDHDSLGLITPNECLENGRISMGTVNGASAAAAANKHSMDILCRRLRPELFCSAGGAGGQTSSTTRAIMSKLQQAAPNGNLALVGSAKVLEKISSVIRMLGSLRPQSQRFPSEIQATAHNLRYARSDLSMAHISTETVAQTFHSAGVGMRHLGYAAHLASFNKRCVHVWGP